MTAPGIYPDMPEADYHAHPALSASGAKLLLDCPQRYRWQRTQPERHTDYFDVGKAAHRLVLGAGAELEVIDGFADWRKGDAKAARDEARAAGKVPLLRHVYDQVVAMADVMRSHPTVAALLAHGQPEMSLFWTDETTGVDLRGRMDWWRNVGRPVIVDPKTTDNASRHAFARSAARYRYHLQAAFYRAGAQAVFGLDEPPPFVFVAQETDPPYLVGVYELDDDALAAGDRLMRHAIDVYRRCVDTDTWPGYDAAVLALPRWATHTEET